MLEAIGFFAVIFFVIYVIDLLFFKEEREERIKAIGERDLKYREKQSRLKFLEYDVVSEFNKKTDKDEALMKLNFKYSDIPEDQIKSLVDKYWNS